MNVKLNITPAQHGLNNGYCCTHEDTYDGAPDSNHPIGLGDTVGDAIAAWAEHADFLNDGDLSGYEEGDELEQTRKVIRVYMTSVRQNGFNDTTDELATKTAAFNGILRAFGFPAAKFEDEKAA